jgi:hypothetical protein
MGKYILYIMYQCKFNIQELINVLEQADSKEVLTIFRQENPVAEAVKEGLINFFFFVIIFFICTCLFVIFLYRERERKRKGRCFFTSEGGETRAFRSSTLQPCLGFSVECRAGFSTQCCISA